MNENKKELFRGHWKECLWHLALDLASVNPKGSRGAGQAKKPLAEFCKVTIGTATTWLDHKVFPSGEVLIRLMCYLNILGYTVIEWERMQQGRRNFAELIGYGLLTGEEAGKIGGYANTSDIYPILCKNKNTGEERLQKMWNTWKDRREELEIRKEEARKLYSLEAQSETRSTTIPKTLEEVPPSRPKAMVSIMEGLLALLEETTISDSDLEDLRRSQGIVLGLSASLTTLSSRLMVSEAERK